MLKPENIITNDWTVDGGSLEYDISDLHPTLSVLLQEYQINSTTYEGKRIYQSDFYLFGPNEIIPGNFQYLPQSIKNHLWEVVFSIKRRFFEEIKPEIVEHFISQEHSLPQRYRRYCNQFSVMGYTIDIEEIKRTIVYQKKTTPVNDGGGRSFY